jgi:hypothetical protein
LWEELSRGAGVLDLRAQTGFETLPQEFLVEELQLNSDSWQRHYTHAMMRLLLIEEAQRHGVHVDEDSLVQAVLNFRRKLGLLEPDQLVQWIADNQLDQAAFVRLLEREALRRWGATLLHAETIASLPDELRIAGEYESLYQRARNKRRVLATSGLEPPSLTDAGIQEHDLWQWYFNADQTKEIMLEEIGELGQRLGFRDIHAFRHAVLREYLYTKIRNDRPSAASKTNG